MKSRAVAVLLLALYVCSLATTAAGVKVAARDATRNRVGFLNAIKSAVGGAKPKAGAKGGAAGGSAPTPSYLLPTDPNGDGKSDFLTPDSNVNPLNANSEFQQNAPETHKTEVLNKGDVPVGVGAGENTVEPFPQFTEVDIGKGLDDGCKNCVYDH
eukprot:CAMPEP_0183346682 /NCGR_PEP_ID=MMETSP0164_2-20130417/11724_1 /TAXON_ID=221442 /ORGANISM="Coccolithus pelagicus ssp braarudi, Strain PLY182g" /LENGTH=155 /DNA_ID=CAMNT_0025517995 /DNA_START=40 /DNA_END=507 /DNA_ORIENTATION=-